MYSAGAPALPLLGAPDRVRVVLLLASEIALLQPDTPTISEVYRRIDGETRQRLCAHPRKFS